MTANYNWPLWRRIAFRFCFLYFGLYLITTPWFEFSGIPMLGGWHAAVLDFFVCGFNDHVIHFQKELTPLNGSGDTSWGWVLLILELSVSAIATVIWSWLDRKRPSYNRLGYLLRTGLRYTLSYFALTYGLIKILLIQMLFPTQSQLASPLGDFLPMRFSWLFIGYSDGYQFFSGMAEVLVGLLLLFRRTTRLGAVLAFGVFLNVMALNLFYDIPVKIFSMHLTAMALFLLIDDNQGLLHFFWHNRTISTISKYHFSSQRKWVKRGRIALKVAFIYMLSMMIFDTFNMYSDYHKSDEPFAKGVFETHVLIKNNDTIPVLANDSLVWKDIIFDGAESGSIDSQDTILRLRYGRGYFLYKNDSVKNVLHAFKFNDGDSIAMFDLKYKILNKDSIEFRTKLHGDSLKLLSVKTKHKFQLANREFHWISERNR
ncbi:MAG: hypothetical protein EOO50_10745 [Flavobacterium sp.]|uniref:hypothetical protein n=1 Tax=Flavobacterium sp. TaxID=239 RepID=UPI001226937E|nr:hypothetical protein [Flavobacterium sp.]RZJ66136.1 MAG: hypothetical protein EOO50_10745 [Flavobacterium sp.]